MDKGDEEFESKVIRIINSQRGQPAPSGLGSDPLAGSSIARTSITAPVVPPSGKADRQEMQFYEHRRSLRLYPVAGQDLQAGFDAFLRDKLKTDSSYRDGIGAVVLRRHRDLRSKAKNEVVATFENREVADAVRALASNLAGQGSSAGIRLHIPGHLMSNFKLLENLGYQMRSVNSCLLYTSPSPRD